MRPVNALSAAGLGQLSGLVAPLQGVLDRLAGNASAVHSFVDAWTTVSQRITQIQRQLEQSATTGTAEWKGDSADKYRRRTDDLAKSLSQFATAAATAASTAQTTAQAVASGRAAANDLITDLIQRLISLVRQLMAAEGGMTATVLAQASQLVNSFAKPVANIERQVQTTISNATKPLTELTTLLGAITRLWDSYAGVDRGQPQTLLAQATSATRGAKKPNPIIFAPEDDKPPLPAHELTHVQQQRGGIPDATGRKEEERSGERQQKTRGGIFFGRDLTPPTLRLRDRDPKMQQETDKFGDSGKADELKSEVQGRLDGEDKPAPVQKRPRPGR
jgi:ABC-type transporter Mla subunit MlaD